MADRRNGVPGDGRSQDDPFAELVRLVERPELFANGPLQTPMPRAEAGRSFGGFEPVDVPSRQFDEFDYHGESAAHDDPAGYAQQEAFASQFDSQRSVQAGAAHDEDEASEPRSIVPRGAPAEPDAHGFAAAPAWVDDVPEDSGIDEALLGLSAPMSPRDSHPGESGSFAPERRESHHDHPARAITLDDFDELIASELAVMRPAPQAGASAFQSIEPDYLETDDYAPEEDERGLYRATAAERMLAGGRRRRLMFFGGGVAAVALVGLFGAYSFLSPAASSFGDEPILIKADVEPVKIAPVDPGGRQVPNQNKAVYERVARNAGPQSPPTQDMLISAAEEPIELQMDDEANDLPGVMVGMSDVAMTQDVAMNSTEPQAAEAAVGQPVLQPHRVRTFDVRPDGTLVPRDETAAAPTPTPAPTQAPASSVGGAVAAAGIVPVDDMRASVPLSAETAVAVAAAEPAANIDALLTAPDAPAAAVPTPEQVIAALAPEPAPVAAPPAATPPPAAAPAGSVFVQISSQPTQALAEQSRDSLAGRYASVIGGRGLTIQSAEIPDRGTYYRVRIVTASADEANSVCQSLQSAGGSCFVTR